MSLVGPVDEWVHALAPAKINLTLHVTGRRDDGYHLLDSLVAFTAIGDRLRLLPGGDLSLAVDGPFADGVPTDGRNLVWKAAVLAGWAGRIELEKNLPHGAGIGGGSSDAAAVLRAVGYNESGLSLGADVPVCQLSRAARMSGIGEEVAPLGQLPEAFSLAVLVNPGVHVPTPQVFRTLQTKDNPPMESLPAAAAGRGDWFGWLARQRNDLEAPAIRCAPVIAGVLQALRDTDGCRLARMSGSGSTCFGLYPDRSAQQAAAEAIGQAHPDWWCVATRLS